MGGLNRTNLGFLTLFLSFIFVLSAIAQAPQSATHPDSSQYSYLKFSLFPFIYEATRPSVPYLWISLQYESQLPLNKKFTYNIAVDYKSTGAFGTGLTFDAYHKELQIRPQVRFYTGRMAFKGYYLGLYPVYTYSRTDVSSYYRAHFWGAGAITGYQFFVQKKIPVELNFWISYQAAEACGYYYVPSDTYVKHEVIWSGLFEVNIGFPIRKKR